MSADVPSRWLAFIATAVPETRRTREWRVQSKSSVLTLGGIAWYSPWRQYVFHPAVHPPHVSLTFNDECLHDLAEFCRVQTKTHHARAAERRRTGMGANAPA